MIYGRDYSGPVICAENSHECDSVEFCAADDCEVFCSHHTTECEGCKTGYCSKHAGKLLTKTDAGMLCETCLQEYGVNFCDKCGCPEPCRKQACIDAHSADADYYDAVASGYERHDYAGRT